eukprot:m.90509 g.90509  ORF g.90509 m.90509 type:complete len:1089 (+) comp9865_c0_seq1:735-4001(+)
MSDEEACEYLRQALAGMQDPSMPQDRLQQIEAELTAFREQPDAWRQCVNYIKLTNDPNVVWFAHSVFEFTVNTRWATVEDSDKAQLREFIFMCIKEQDKSTLSHVANKMYKVYADMGKQDWPHNFPNYFDLIFDMLGSDRDTILVGLQLLRVVLEECVSRTGVTARRADELLALVSTQVAQLLAALEAILQATYESAALEAGKRSLEKRLPTNLGVPPTPRGSPTPLEVEAPQDEGGPADMSEPEMFFQFGADAEQRVVAAFGCVAQLFGWINLAEAVSPSLLDILGLYARLNHTSCAPAGALAVACFNEMLSSHGVPLTFEEALLKLFEHMVVLLDKVTKSDPSRGDKNPLDEIDPEYNIKLIEFLGFFITKHFRRVESSPQFEILDFLMLLFRFTFLQTDNDRFVSCLDVCQAFVDVLVVKQEQVGAESVVVYRECVLMLATEVVDRLRFTHHCQTLDRIDDSVRNEDGLTEWDEHLRDCTMVLGQISVLFPAELLDITVPLFRTDMEAYVGITNYIQQSPDGSVQLNFPDEATQNGFYVVCRDLRTTTQLVGKLSNYFIEGDMAHIAQAFHIVKSIVDLFQFSEDNKLYCLGHIFSTVHAELAGALSAFVLWFQRALRTFHDQPDEGQRLRDLTETTVVCAATLLRTPPPGEDAPVLEQAAAELLGRMCTVARPPFLLEIDVFSALLDEATGIMSRLSGPARTALTVALAHAIILPWHDVMDDKQDWVSREGKFVEFFSSIFAPLADGSAPDAAWVVAGYRALAAVVRSVRDQPRAVQLIVTKAIQPTLPVVLQLFETCADDPTIIAAVLELQLALFESIAPLLGEEYMRMSIGVFMNFFSDDVLRSLASGDDGAEMVIETFFKVLQEVVRGHGALFRRFFGDVLTLLVTAVATLGESDDIAIHVQMALFEVLRFVLLDHWRTFYPGGPRPGADPAAADDGAENQEALGVVLQAITGSFNSNDLEPFRYNLETLVEVNAKKRLFSKQFFRENLYIDLLGSLLNVMVAKTHALLEEEICDLLYELGRSDWSAFYTVALPTVLSSLQGLDDTHRQQLASQFRQVDDKPSFVEQLHEFCVDLAHFQKQ